MKPDAITTVFIRRILSVAETGEAEWNPSAVYLYADDNRFNPPRKQVTVSIGFTESGNLGGMLQIYLEKGGQETALRPYLDSLGTKTRPTLAGDKRFIALLKAAGKEDPKMMEAQQEAFDRFYLGPAFDWADKYGFTEPLSYLVIADSFLHSGSMLGFLMERFPEKKPVDGGEEKKWIKDYLEARHKWLREHSNKILNKTIYRADAYLREIAQDNWTLADPLFVMHGTAVRRAA
jgi:chitosanase